MGSRRGPEQTIGQDFKMKLLLAACMLGLATAGQDYQMFMKWAKTKALESCWGEENMKLHTVNMKKAVAKCQQVDAPELNLPPFRLLNRFTNNLVGLAYKMEDQDNEMQRYMQYYKFSKMMDSMKDHSYERQYENQYKDDRMDMMEKMKMMEMMMKYMPKFQSQERQGVYQTAYKTDDDNYNMAARFRNMNNGDQERNSMSSMFKRLSQMRYKRQADDSLALNDRLKDKLEHMMKEHVEEISNMTCVLREMKVIDQNNNIDVTAMKKDAEQYKLPSAWFGERYEEILDSCYQVAENLPASLQDKVLPNNYNGPMRNLAKIKSFMTCCKSAKMKLCMYQDTKKKIETNFGPVDQLLDGFNNQITEEQVFYMVNELLQGDDDQFM